MTDFLDDWKRGEEHPRHVLTSAQVTAARSLYATGRYRIQDVCTALRLPVSRYVLAGILRGLSWAHQDAELIAACKAVGRMRQGRFMCSSRISAADVVALRQRLEVICDEKGELDASVFKELAEEFGVDRKCIRRLITYRTFRPESLKRFLWVEDHQGEGSGTIQL